MCARGAAQQLQEADGGPFAAPGAEAPRFIARRTASRRLQIAPADFSLVAASGVPLAAACTRGLATAYAMDVSRTKTARRGHIRCGDRIGGHSFVLLQSPLPVGERHTGYFEHPSGRWEVPTRTREHR